MKKKKFFQLYKHSYNLIDMLYFILYSDKEYFDETRTDLSADDCNNEKFPIPTCHLLYFIMVLLNKLEKSGASARAKIEINSDGRIFFYLQSSKDLDDFINCGGLFNFGQEIFENVNLEEIVELSKKEYGAVMPNVFLAGILNKLE